jgi:hypothetical protein
MNNMHQSSGFVWCQ